MHEVLEKIGSIGIVPVIKIDDPEKAVPLARALIAGGIPCAEITFRTAQGIEAVRRIAAEVPEILLGAGTVLTVEQAEAACSAGAKFVVSPGFNKKVVNRCLEKGIPVVPGCANPSDIECALEAGLEVVKFFPAEQSGGLDYIKAVAAPYGGIRFMPTGGINAGNIARYTAYEKVLACGGSWMAGADLMDSGAFEKITALCREAVNTMLGFTLVHVGINGESETGAMAGADRFAALFGFAVKPGSSSVFAGGGIEITKTPGRGKQGHIALAAWSVPKAAACLERLGAVLDYGNAKRGPSGELTVIYLAEEILGFAVH
ncbi:MAG: bifunctional 4-hydroxy-2-oxoglutarate aldolase/2-dehydro-3-deoxy-phosphogluconate aldolase, partial [Treponema sp.]|nr:bifunctional 4-hydroxy-2-oxoglutarate aldolase/2-dehydro-3-deoxy-phosphogluconate aldolase [Treponema sp.]